jgi:hypothetical protein
MKRSACRSTSIAHVTGGEQADLTSLLLLHWVLGATLYDLMKPFGFYVGLFFIVRNLTNNSCEYFLKKQLIKRCCQQFAGIDHCLFQKCLEIMACFRLCLYVANAEWILEKFDYSYADTENFNLTVSQQYLAMMSSYCKQAVFGNDVQFPSLMLLMCCQLPEVVHNSTNLQTSFIHGHGIIIVIV